MVRTLLSTLMMFSYTSPTMSLEKLVRNMSLSQLRTTPRTAFSRTKHLHTSQFLIKLLKSRRLQIRLRIRKRIKKRLLITVLKISKTNHNNLRISHSKMMKKNFKTLPSRLPPSSGGRGGKHPESQVGLGPDVLSAATSRTGR